VARRYVTLKIMIQGCTMEANTLRQIPAMSKCGS